MNRSSCLCTASAVHRPRTRLLAGLCGGLLLAACGESPVREFRIGLIGGTTGPMATASGIPAIEGARLAIDELNATGGVEIGGRWHRLVLVERDVATHPDASAAAARALINLDSVHAIVGPQITTQALAAAAVAEQSEIPMISPMASGPALTAGRRMVFRLAFVDAFQGELLARYAFDSLALRRAAVLYDAASPYGRDVFRLFRSTFEARGGAIAAEETFTTENGRDFLPQLRRLLARDPDVILLPNYAVYDSIQVRQARELGFRGRFLGSDSWDPIALAQVDSVRGAVIVANWDRRTAREQGRRFTTAYEARYQRPPRTTAAATYDAIQLLAAVARRTGTLAGPALADSLRRFGRFEGASARLIFRGGGDPVRGGVILEFLQGRDSVRFVDSPPP